MDRLIAAISQRVNPGGVKEVTVRPYGNEQVEIIIPRADDAEIDLIKRKISDRRCAAVSHHGQYE